MRVFRETADALVGSRHRALRAAAFFRSMGNRGDARRNAA